MAMTAPTRRAWLATPAAAAPWLVSGLAAFLTELDVDRLWLFAVENDLVPLATALETLSPFAPLSPTRARHVAMVDASWTALRKLSGATSDATAGSHRLKTWIVDFCLSQLARLHVPLAANPDRRLAMLTPAAPCSVPGFVMYVAAERANLESVVWLHHAPDYDPVVALGAAASHRQPAVVSWLLDMWSGVQSPDAVFNVRCVHQYRDDPALGVMAWTVRVAGAAYSQLHVLTKKWGYYCLLREPKDIYPVMDLAAKHGDLETLKRFHSHPVFSSAITEDAADQAAKNGHFEVVEWLYTNHHLLCGKSTALHEACVNGHLDIVIWLHGHAIVNLQDSTFGGVIRGGHLHVLEWMMNTLTGMLQWYVNSLVERAAGCGQLEIARWLVEVNQLAVTLSAVEEAAFSGNLELTKYLSSKLDKPLPTSVLDSAAHSGNPALIQWLVEDKGLWSEHCFLFTARSSSIEAIQYLYFVELSRRSTDQINLLMKGCWIYCGYFDSLLWLLDHGIHELVLNKHGFDQIYSLLRTVDRTRMHLGWGGDRTDIFEWKSTTENLAQLHVVIERLVQDYDPSFLTQINWLPRWAVRQQSLSSLRCLAEIKHPMLFKPALFRSVLRESMDENLVKWFLLEDISLFSTRVIKWGARYGKAHFITWLIKELLPGRVSQEVLLNSQRVFQREATNEFMRLAI